MEYCVCGHAKDRHFDEDILVTCRSTTEIRNNGTYYSFCKCREFKLDNLKLIEDLAEEKGLV